MKGLANQPKVELTPDIFKAYDIRGIVGETIGEEIFRTIGQVIGSEALDQGQSSLVVGRDGRLSSESLCDALIEGILDSGKHVILEIDWQGARQVKQKMPETVCIFILPPSREALEQRLNDRDTDDQTTIKRRMKSADREMSRWNDAEYLVVNEVFDQALYDLECIIHAQGMTKQRQILKNKALIASIPKEMV